MPALRVSDPRDLKFNLEKFRKELNMSKKTYYSMYLKAYRFYLIGNKEATLDF